MKSNHPIFQAGFTLMEILVIVVMMGLLAAIAISNFVNARGKMQTQTRINNPGETDAIAFQFAVKVNQKAETSAIYESRMTPFIRPAMAVSIPDYVTGGIYTKIVASALPAISVDDLTTAPHLQP